MPPAARVLDSTSHPGVIAGPGVDNVLIGGLPAAVFGDAHACGFPPPAVHPPSTMIGGSGSVLIGGRPAIRVGDAAGCGAQVIVGAFDVEIGG